MLNNKYNLYTNNTILNTIKYIVNNDLFEKDFTYHYLYILHVIRIYPYLDRRYTNNDFIPLNMKVLKKYISYNYAHKFIANMVAVGIIEENDDFKPGFKSKSYKLKDKYRTDKFFLTPVEDLKLNKKILSVISAEKTAIISRNDSYSFVTKCMENLILSKNIPSDELINEFYILTADIFDRKFSVIDKTSDRLHNNLTNIPTDLRKYITYDNKEITQVDIKNSQPVFLYTMLRNYSIPEKELEKYKEVVCSGKFYEFFALRLGYELNEATRSKFKKRIFGGVLFDKNRASLSKYEIVFREEFPHIFSVIRNIKSKNYKQVAILLQKEESKYIFYAVAKIKEKTKSKIPLVTIHDSIATTTGNEILVKSIMENIFRENYNIIPKFKIEKFA